MTATERHDPTWTGSNRCTGIFSLWICCVVASCATSVDAVTGKVTLNRYTLAAEAELGTKLSTLLLAGQEAAGQVIDADDEYTRAVWRIADRILRVPANRARMPPLFWEIHVVATDMADAICFPGGQIVVLAGLMRSGLVRDEDEAAALIAHEIAHGAARHATEQRTLEELERSIAPLGRFFGPRLVALADSSENTAQYLAGEIEQYDRSQEIEADVVGLELMARAGYDPGAALRIWERLAATELINDPRHPSFQQRSEELGKHLPVALRLVGPSPPGELWRWSEAPFGTRSIPAGVLPFGPNVASRFLRGKDLRLELKIITGPEGEAPRLAIEVRAADDLVRDRLPLTAGLELRSERRLLSARQLAFLSPLERSVVPMRVALPRLPKGRYELTAWALIGALRAEIRRSFDVI